MESYTDQNFNNDVAKLKKIPKYAKNIDELVKESETQAAVENAAGRIWYITYKLSDNDTTTWNVILRKNLGYDIALDYGEGIIHPSEPEAEGDKALRAIIQEAVQIGKGSCVLLSPTGEQVAFLSTARSDPATGEGKRELMATAKQLEADRDLAKKKSPWIGIAGSVMQIAIVLLTASILSSGMLMFWAGLGAMGAALVIMAQGLFLFF